MTFLRLSEPFNMDQIDRLIRGITGTNFDSIKLMLYEKQENYTKCLQLLVESQIISFSTAKIKDQFSWIIQTYFMLDARLNENTSNQYKLKQFQLEILHYAPVLTRIDSHKSVGLIDCLYKD